MAYVDGIAATVLTANRETITANSKVTAKSKTREDPNPIRQPPEFQGTHLPDLGLHPLVLITLSGIAWFLAVRAYGKTCLGYCCWNVRYVPYALPGRSPWGRRPKTSFSRSNMWNSI